MSLAQERYVSLTTYKRNGDPVATPVWIAPVHEGQLGFTTDPDSWKAKRLRRNPSVLVQPCDGRGRLKSGSTPVAGTGRVLREGPEQAEIAGAIRKKYGIQSYLAGVLFTL